MPGDRAPSRRERRTDDAPRTWERISVAYWLPVFFAVLAMGALALGPAYLDREFEREQQRLTELLEPTRNRIAQIQLENTKRAFRWTAWALRETPNHRQAYQDAQRRVSDLLQGLAELTQNIDPELRVQVAELSDANLIWSGNHREVVEATAIDSIARARFYQVYNRDLDLFAEVLAKQQQLQESVGAEVQRVQGRIAEARERRERWTIALVIVAFLASLSVAVIGLGIRNALREAHQRRRDAVWARRRTAAVLRGTADGVMGLDLDGRATFVNPSGARILGRAATEIEGRSIHEIVHGPNATHPEEDCPLRALASEDEETAPADDWFVRADGTEFPVRLSSLPMIDGVEHRGAVLTYSDMTEIRAAEEALREAVRAREEVVSVVSHDLRNPVGTIFAAADLLHDGYLDPDEAVSQAEVIQRSARRMDRLIRDLLDVTRIEQGGFPVHMRPMAPSLLLREAEELLRPVVERNGLNLEVGCPEGLPRVSADTDRMIQVFSNLVGNAIRFTPAGGRISMVAAQGEPGEILFEVSDTGVGIREEDQRYLFDRYWKSGQAEAGGTGLGLAIVHGIIQAHGGTVWVESAPGEGARFLFILHTAERTTVHRRLGSRRRGGEDDARRETDARPVSTAYGALRTDPPPS